MILMPIPLRSCLFCCGFRLVLFLLLFIRLVYQSVLLPHHTHHIYIYTTFNLSLSLLAILVGGCLAMSFTIVKEFTIPSLPPKRCCPFFFYSRFFSFGLNFRLNCVFLVQDKFLFPFFNSFPSPPSYKKKTLSA